jgi:hypothetical protein
MSAANARIYVGSLYRPKVLLAPMEYLHDSVSKGNSPIVDSSTVRRLDGRLKE